MNTETAKPPLLPDQKQRSRFAEDLKTSFSVIAPAGVGKTRSIVDRVTNILLSHPDRTYVSRLAVVTYTNKAADEMQQRARERLLDTKSGAVLMRDLNSVFFGTIHSFCVKLLRTHGHYIGLAGELDVVTDDDEDALWIEFFRGFDFATLKENMPAGLTDNCFRHLPAQTVLQLARRVRPPDVASLCAEAELGACPPPDFEAILGFSPDPRNAENVKAGQDILNEWRNIYEDGRGYAPFPQYDKGGAAFQEAWKDAFSAPRLWLQKASQLIAGLVALEYQRYRVETGRLTYADQIRLVLNLLDHPEAGRRLRSLRYNVILDEAQDTDPDQFRALLELTSHREPGAFCMVGDPQQSIYGDRSDLSFYKNVRKRLVSEYGGEELSFHVTFRCARKVIETVNVMCPSMLNQPGSGVSYVELIPAPKSIAGSVNIIRVPEERRPKAGTNGRIPMNDLAEAEARFIAESIAGSGPGKLGARGWSEIAVLCARRKWIQPIEDALNELDLPVRNYSRTEIHGDNPACAWFTSLVRCMASPSNGYEIAGLLRELFGISDEDLYLFSRGNGALFQIKSETPGDGPVPQALNLLFTARAVALRLPLLDACLDLADRTQLSERVMAADPDLREPADNTLQRLLAIVSEAESDGSSMYDLAELLEKHFMSRLDSAPAAENCIQLITCHSAKGLEWDSVVLPFFYRTIARRGGEYPYVHENKKEGSSSIVFARDWLDEKDEAVIREGIAQENQRLLYVALTRARNMLTVMDDSCFMTRTKDSFAECLGVTEGAHSFWSELPSSVPESIEIGEDSFKAVQEASGFVNLTEDEKRRAFEKAGDFFRRCLPSSLAHGADEEGDPEVRIDAEPEWNTGERSEALAYGLWWHGMMEDLDWLDPQSWRQTAERLLNLCPHPDRGLREWELFMNSDLAKRISAQCESAFSETPFLRIEAEDSCVEGFIDLVIRERDGATWLVIDWKTDSVPPGQDQDLRRKYIPQVERYVESVRDAAGRNARIIPVIYSTCLGAVV